MSGPSEPNAPEVSGSQLVKVGLLVIVVASAAIVGFRWLAGIPPVLRPDKLPTVDGGEAAPPLPLDPNAPNPGINP